MGKTKAEEYETLRKIKEILEDFDPEETYVGKAFEGCIEQAEENLHYNGMLSWKSRYLNKQASNRELSDRIANLAKQLNYKDDAIARLEDAKNQLNNKIDELDGELDDKDRTYTNLEGMLEEAHNQISNLKQTILELKAKLYDVITAGKEAKE